MLYRTIDYIQNVEFSKINNFCIFHYQIHFSTFLTLYKGGTRCTALQLQLITYKNQSETKVVYQ